MLCIDFVNCGYNFGVLGDAELSNESIRRKGGKGKMYSFAYSVMKNNLNKSLREKKRWKKKNIYIKVQIDRAATSDIKKARKLRHKFVKLDGVL